jgi:glyoxylase-like metal-dependent hydrolase (beta-lactamase superfamily II)
VYIEQVVVGVFEVNCWVVWGERRAAIVFDPGGDAQRIAELLDRKSLTVAAYMLTHGHVDHVAALAELHGRYPAPIGLHPSDAAWAFTPENHMPPFYPPPDPPGGAGVSRLFRDGDSFEDGGLAYRVMATPGHTPGSVCFIFEDKDVLVSGDTLFQSSVGRTDLAGGDTRALAGSLRALAALPDRTHVCSGHGPATTVAEEKAGNLFVRTACRGGSL